MNIDYITNLENQREIDILATILDGEDNTTAQRHAYVDDIVDYGANTIGNLPESAVVPDINTSSETLQEPVISTLEINEVTTRCYNEAQSQLSEASIGEEEFMNVLVDPFEIGNDMLDYEGGNSSHEGDEKRAIEPSEGRKTRSNTRNGQSIGKRVSILNDVLSKNPLKDAVKHKRKSKKRRRSRMKHRNINGNMYHSRVSDQPLLQPKNELLRAASTIEKLFDTVPITDPVYQRIAKMVINTVHQNKQNVSDYIIDLTMEDEINGCLNKECNCKSYTKERYNTNGFYISSFPSEHFDNSRVKTISEYVEKSGHSSRINFGSEKDVHRYGLNWSDLKSQENIQYVDALLNLLEKEVSNFLENGIANETGSPEAFLGQYTGTRDAALILSLPGGGAQDGHTDYEGQEDGVSVPLALQENTSLDIVLGFHADNEKVSPFSNVPIPTFHYIVFHGLLCHRGVGYSEYNLRLHAYFDFVGNKRTRNKVYNRVYESTPRRKRISRVLPQRKLMRASDE